MAHLSQVVLLLALLLHVTPLVSAAPALITIRVQADEGDQIGVSLDGEHYYRSSIESRGDQRTHVFVFRDVPEGTYIVSAVQADQWGNVEALRSQTVIVN